MRILKWKLPLVLFCLVLISGCGTFFNRKDRVKDDFSSDSPVSDGGVEYVGSLSDPWGLGFAKVEGVALVTRLDGTGSDPEPSSKRNVLLGDMKAHDVYDPAELLASKDTAMVLVQAYIPPAAQKGDSVDVFVMSPNRTRTTSLRGGFLLDTRLMPMEAIQNQIRTGHVMAKAQGNVFVDAIFEGDGEGKELRGVAYGGGYVTKPRPFGLIARSEVASIGTTTAIASALNRRFSTYEAGQRKGVATAKSDELIELLMPEEYKHNLTRYIDVIRSVAVDEAEGDRALRIEQLQRDLMDPFLSAQAAIRLEAIGQDAQDALLQGLNSPVDEVRFYSAEALAYIGHPAAAKVLGQIAQTDDEFRFYAMTALVSMLHLDAGIQLSELLHADSKETRYGAFRSLLSRSENDMSVRGQLMNDEFYYHVVASDASPFIHFARGKRAEIAVFGRDMRIGEGFVYVKPGLTIRGVGNGTMTVSSFGSNGQDQTLTCSTRVDDLVRTVVSMGADFEQVLELMRHAERTGTLQGEVAIHAVPKLLDEEVPSEGDMDEGEQDAPSGFRPRANLPGLFNDSSAEAKSEEDRFSDFSETTERTSPKKKGFFGRMTGWW